MLLNHLIYPENPALDNDQVQAIFQCTHDYPKLEKYAFEPAYILLFGQLHFLKSNSDEPCKVKFILS